MSCPLQTDDIMHSVVIEIAEFLWLKSVSVEVCWRKDIIYKPKLTDQGYSLYQHWKANVAMDVTAESIMEFS